MERLLVFVGALAGGWIGWWAGERFGLFAAFFLSLVGTALGVYFGRKYGKGS